MPQFSKSASPPPLQDQQHENVPRHGESRIKRRIRTRQACEPCRKRRRKCNGHFPCGQCISYSYHCEYVGGLGSQTKNSQIQTSDLSEDEEAVERSPPRRAAAADSSQDQQTSRRRQSKSTGYLPSEHGEQSPAISRAMVDPVKGRYSNAHSSILLPRRVGHSIDLPTELKFHSYGWNLNTRLEPTTLINPIVCHYLTVQDMSQYSLIFFKVVDPVYHFIDRGRYFDRCSMHWASPKPLLEDFEALVAGVVALGSLFSENPSPVESQLVEHAKRVVDLGCAYSPGRLSLDQTAAWVCRTLYLRLTTRPHLAWYASCSSMHVAEAMGLHVDLRDVDMAAGNAPNVTLELMTSRKNLLQCATFLNAIISADYGRSRVILQDAASSESQSGSSLVKLTSLLIRLEKDLQSSERLGILSCIKSLPDEPPVFVLLKTDVAIHLYRKHVNLEIERLPPEESKIMLSIIKTALTEARFLLPHRHPWWNILFTPFQSLLVLLAMDSDDSLALVNENMSVLSAVHKAFPTHLAIEVLNTAEILIQGLEKRKTKQARFLNKASIWDAPKETSATAANGGSEQMQLVGQSEAFFDNWVAGDMDWFQLLGGGSTGQVISSDNFNFP